MKQLFTLLLLILPSVALAERPYTGQVQTSSMVLDFQNGQSYVTQSQTSGSFVVMSDHLVLTNYHVVADHLHAQQMGMTSVLTLRFIANRYKVGRVIKVDPIIDLALVEFRGGLPPGSHRIGLATTFDPKELTVGGYGFGSEYTECELPDGYQESTAYGFKLMGPNFFSFETVALCGQSGAPVINERGELCGVLWGSDYPEQQRAYGIKLDAVIQFLGAQE